MFIVAGIIMAVLLVSSIYLTIICLNDGMIEPSVFGAFLSAVCGFTLFEIIKEIF